MNTALTFSRVSHFLPEKHKHKIRIIYERYVAILHRSRSGTRYTGLNAQTRRRSRRPQMPSDRHTEFKVKTADFSFKTKANDLRARKPQHRSGAGDRSRGFVEQARKQRDARRSLLSAVMQRGVPPVHTALSRE